MVFVTWQGLLIAGAFYRFALDLFWGAEVDDLLFNLIEIIFIHAEALHHNRSFVLSSLAKLPRDNSKSDAVVFEHVQDPIEDSFVKQVANQLQGKTLHSNAAWAFFIFQSLI